MRILTSCTLALESVDLLYGGSGFWSSVISSNEDGFIYAQSDNECRGMLDKLTKPVATDLQEWLPSCRVRTKDSRLCRISLIHEL